MRSCRFGSLIILGLVAAASFPIEYTGLATYSWSIAMKSLGKVFRASERVSTVELFKIGLTDHLEGPRDQSSSGIFDELTELIQLADRLGVDYAWFTEHHAHAHWGHLPTPLLFALHLAGQTREIRLGTAIICLNLHHPLDVAEQVAVADVLTKGRMAVGFGSGSTPEEFRLFGLPETGRTRTARPLHRGARVDSIGVEWTDTGVRSQRIAVLLFGSVPSAVADPGD